MHSTTEVMVPGPGLFGGGAASPLILVTGGAGFIGHELVAQLLDRGGRVCVLDDLSTGLRNRLPETSDCFQFIEGSVLDQSALARLPDEIALVFHLASVVGMRRVHQGPSYAARVSDKGTAHVLAATGSAPAVIMSSSSVYGRTPNSISRETDVVSWEGGLEYDGGEPGYACGKLMLEGHGERARRDGRLVMTVRPFNVVGPGQLGSYGMVLPRFAAAALTNEPLWVFDDGLQVRSFIHVRKFTDCLVKLALSPQAWDIDRRAINLGAPQMTSILDLAKITIKEAGSSSPIRFQPYETVYPGKYDVRYRFPDTAQLTMLLGPIIWPQIHDIVRDVLSFIGSRLETGQTGVVATAASASHL